MNDAIVYLQRYKGKKVIVKTLDGYEIEGVLKRLEKSKHGGLGNVILYNNGYYYLIRGSNILLIVLDSLPYSSKSINK